MCFHYKVKKIMCYDRIVSVPQPI